MYYGVETIKRQTRAVCGCLVAGQSPWARTQTAAYRLYARSVCESKAPLRLHYGRVALYECYTPLLFARMSDTDTTKCCRDTLQKIQSWRGDNFPSRWCQNVNIVVQCSDGRW